MANVELVCEIRVKWWVRPLLLTWGGLLLMVGMKPNYEAMGKFTSNYGTTQRVVTREIT